MNKDDIHRLPEKKAPTSAAQIALSQAYPEIPPRLPKALEDIPLRAQYPFLPKEVPPPAPDTRGEGHPMPSLPQVLADIAMFQKAQFLSKEIPPAPSITAAQLVNFRTPGERMSAILRQRLQNLGAPFAANDNISHAIHGTHELAELQQEVEDRMQELLESLVIDTTNDHNTRETAKRVAKMYLREVFKGRYLPAPDVTSFPNAKKLDEIYTCGPITVRSACSHHLVPIVGKCWIGVIPGERVIGLSKFNRIVEWIASRPQIQEELSVQIADYIENEIKPLGLAVVIKATHMCMTWRGVREPQESTMTNSVMRGYFRDNDSAKAEFMQLIK